MNLNEITGKIVNAAFTVHSSLGPGLLEQVYKACLKLELEERALLVQQEVLMPVLYKGLKLDAGFRVDLIVESEIVIELKAVESIAPIHKAQLLTYLKLANKKLGLLINFNTPVIKDGIHRLIN